MKAGKIASLSVVLGTTVLAAAICQISMLVPWVAEHPLRHGLVVLLLFGGVAAAVFIPLGIVVDRGFVSVCRYIEQSASGDAASSHGPKWLQPVTRAFTGAIDRFRQHDQQLRGQIRELEVRHRVTEAERRQIEAVLHTLGDAVIVTDAFDEIEMANDAAAELLGFDLESAIHQSIGKVISDERLPRLVSEVRESANFRNPRRVEHELSDAATGGRRFYEIAMTCVENLKHDVGGVVTILHDQTRERELSQMKSDFVSKASHELRTPLSSMRAYVEMLVDGEASDEQSRQEFYRILQNETERLSRLIDNMLNISRIEAGIVQIEREKVDLRLVCERAISTLEPQAAEKSITLHPKMAGIDLCVEGDADMLYQVVLNLISNAVKYTPEGGRVTISADSDNLTRSVVVSVADTGLGIPPDAITKLFDKFFRIDNYKRIAKGTGLGLSLCKHIVETVHHGQIGVESKLGMGSRFWFSIPMRYAGSQAA